MMYIFGGAFDPPHVGHAAIVKAILHYKNPEKIIIIPSSERDDKAYHVSDAHRLAMLGIFVEEIIGGFPSSDGLQPEKIILDDYFLKNWKGEMITRDVDKYCREKYGEDIVHIFGTDTIASMPEWDDDQYAAKVVKKLFVPRVSESSPQGGEGEGCGISEKNQAHLPSPPNLGGDHEHKVVSESSPQGGEGEGCGISEKNQAYLPSPPNLGGGHGHKVVSESSPQGGEGEGCVTFVSPKSHLYLKEYAKELRKNQTYPEYLAWKNIFSKKQLLGYKTLRQHTLGPYIVDFYVHALRLIIEIDGDIHASQKNKDRKRDTFFETLGYRIVRIPAFEILGNISGVYEFLKEHITHLPNPPNLGGNSNTHLPNPPNLGGNSNTHLPNPPNLGGDQKNLLPSLHGGGEKGGEEYYLKMIQQVGIENYKLFTDSHFPDISSTELRERIPEYATLKAYYENDSKFIIPGLSKRISRYILEHRLYRQKERDREKVHSQGNKKGLSTLPKPRILVHVCCGPDVTMPILALRDEYDVICFWYDPNIEPREEHDRRFEAFVKVCEVENIPFIKGAYDVKNFHTRIRGLERTPEKGEKCTHCYDMRMYVAAKLAKRLGISLYTSSLNTSPKKDLDKLFAIGHMYARRFGITFLDIPFRKRGGFEHSVAYTREHDIYRQNYCGCIYSIPEGGDSDMKKRMVG